MHMCDTWPIKDSLKHKFDNSIRDMQCHMFRSASSTCKHRMPCFWHTSMMATVIMILQQFKQSPILSKYEGSFVNLDTRSSEIFVRSEQIRARCEPQKGWNEFGQSELEALQINREVSCFKDDTVQRFLFLIFPNTRSIRHKYYYFYIRRTLHQKSYSRIVVLTHGQRKGLARFLNTTSTSYTL